MRIGQNFVITNGESFNPLCRNIRASICLERSTSIILKGVTIGARSIIGGGSVVTKSIPADCIIV